MREGVAHNGTIPSHLGVVRTIPTTAPNALVSAAFRRFNYGEIAPGSENTKNLLRQSFPKGTNLSVHSQERLDEVARAA